jgi:hypothetical protein
MASGGGQSIVATKLMSRSRVSSLVTLPSIAPNAARDQGTAGGKLQSHNKKIALRALTPK